MALVDELRREAKSPPCSMPALLEEAADRLERQAEAQDKVRAILEAHHGRLAQHVAGDLLEALYEVAFQ